MKIVISDEFVDEIVVGVLKDQMDSVKMDIKRLKKLKKSGNIQPCQQQDLTSDIAILECMETVYEYFGGKL